MNKIEYLLTCAAEEGGEISQAAAKCARFGLYDRHPINDDIPNAALLIREINDLLGVVEAIEEMGHPSFCMIGDRKQIDEKKEKLKKWMNYSSGVGCLDVD